MKLKYKFVIREVGGTPVAVAVGTDHAHFNGMVKLNESAKVLFELLQQGTDEAEMEQALCAKYEVTPAHARQTAAAFAAQLRENGLLDE